MSTSMISGNVLSMNVVTVTWDIPSIATITTEEETFTLAGVKVGDFVVVSKNSLDAGIMFGSARVTAADTIGVQIVNPTAGAIDAASQDVKVLVVRSEGQQTATKLTF